MPSDTSIPIPPLQLTAIRDFFIALYGTYPHLFADPQREFGGQVMGRLQPVEENLTFANMLDVQQNIFKRMEAVGAGDWYRIFHQVYVRTMRTSLFARQLMNSLLGEAQVVIGRQQFDKVLVPGCGRFYEVQDISRAFGPCELDAVDIDANDLEISRTAAPDMANVLWSYDDLTQPQGLEASYDLLLFMHPQVCDYDWMWQSPVYKRYGEEFLVPIDELRKASTFKFIPPAWVKILDNSFNALRPGGFAIFLCYEHRELVTVQSYLANKPHLQQRLADCNNFIVDPAFSADMLACLETERQASAEFVAMGAYRALLVVEKVSG